eukprot:1145836-Pelagomonas_calceolata.AAC.20
MSKNTGNPGSCVCMCVRACVCVPVCARVRTRVWTDTHARFRVRACIYQTLSRARKGVAVILATYAREIIASKHRFQEWMLSLCQGLTERRSQLEIARSGDDGT